MSLLWEESKTVPTQAILWFFQCQHITREDVIRLYDTALAEVGAYNDTANDWKPKSGTLIAIQGLPVRLSAAGKRIEKLKET